MIINKNNIPEKTSFILDYALRNVQVFIVDVYNTDVNKSK